MSRNVKVRDRDVSKSTSKEPRKKVRTGRSTVYSAEARSYLQECQPREYVDITFDDEESFVEAGKFMFRAGMEQRPIAWRTDRVAKPAVEILSANGFKFREIDGPELSKLQAETVAKFNEYYKIKDSAKT